jgi:hypothetical protein
VLSAVADDADAPNHRGDDGDAGYPEGVTTEGGDTGSESRPTPPRRFGELPGLVVPDDFDEPLPDEDWPIAETDLRDALLESEADLAAGRTVGEDEILREPLIAGENSGASTPFDFDAFVARKRTPEAHGR